jgi:hypothetical protein
VAVQDLSFEVRSHLLEQLPALEGN